MVPIPMSMCQCADDDDKYSDDKTQNIVALISCGNLKLISKNFSKAAKKSLAGLVKTNANLCPDIPLFCYFLTVRHNKNFCGGFKKQFSLTLFSKNKIKLFIISACILSIIGELFAECQNHFQLTKQLLRS